MYFAESFIPPPAETARVTLRGTKTLLHIRLYSKRPVAALTGLVLDI